MEITLEEANKALGDATAALLDVVKAARPFLPFTEWAQTDKVIAEANDLLNLACYERNTTGVDRRHWTETTVPGADYEH